VYVWNHIYSKYNNITYNFIHTQNHIFSFYITLLDLTEVIAVTVSRALQPFNERFNIISQEHNITSHNFWTESGRSTAEKTAFKNRWIDYYDRQERYVFSPPDVVIASHIKKNCMHGVRMSKFGLTFQDSTSPRNGLLMLKIIEERFDIIDVYLLYDPFKKMLTLKVCENLKINEIIFKNLVKLFVILLEIKSRNCPSLFYRILFILSCFI